MLTQIIVDHPQDLWRAWGGGPSCQRLGFISLWAWRIHLRLQEILREVVNGGVLRLTAGIIRLGEPNK